MGILVINKGLDSEAVVGSYCRGILEYRGQIIPESALPTLKEMGVDILYIYA